MYFATPPLTIEDVKPPADAQHVGGVFARPEFIIFHSTKGTHSDQWLSSDPMSDVSSNRLIKPDGRIIKICGDLLCTHGQGFAVMGPFGPPGSRVTVPVGGATVSYAPRLRFNAYVLCIEYEAVDRDTTEFSDAMLLSGARQTIEWQGKYGALPILSHWQVDNRKDDPLWFPWGRFYRVYFQQLGAVLNTGKWA